MSRRPWTVLAFLTALAGLAMPPAALAGGGPQTTLVVINRQSDASMEIGSAYVRRRLIPPENVVTVSTPPDPSAAGRFDTDVVGPVWDRIRALGGQITHVVLIQGIPYRVNGLSAATVVSFGGTQNVGVLNPIYDTGVGAEPGLHMRGDRNVIVAMLAAPTVQEALALIDRSVEADFTRPAGTIYLCDGVGPRGVRRGQYAAVVERLRGGGIGVQQVPGSKLTGKTDVMGYMTGDVWVPVAENRYLPGAIVDNLTSFGGRLYEESGQMSILSAISAGASAAYGAVSEPTNNPQRWSNASLFLLYAGGFTLGECYWQTVASPLYGIVIGDPLMQPWALRPVVSDGLLSPKVEGDTVVFEGEVSAVGQGSLSNVLLISGQNRVDMMQARPPSGSVLHLELYVPENMPAGIAKLMESCPFRTLAVEVAVEEGMTIESALARLALEAAAREALSGPEGLEVASQGRNLILKGRTATGWGSFLGWRCSLRSEQPAALRVVRPEGRLFAMGFQPTVASLRLPQEEPTQGDSLALTLAGHTVAVTAGAGQTIEQMVNALGRQLGELARTPEGRNLEGLGLRLARTGGQLYLVLLQAPEGLRDRLAGGVMKVSPAEGSKWKAGELRPSTAVPGWPARPAWAVIPVRGAVRNARIRGVFPRSAFASGYNDLLLVVQGGEPSASMATFRGSLMLEGGAQVSVTSPGTVTGRFQVDARPTDPGQGKGLVVLVDGRPVAAGPVAQGRFELDTATMGIAAGPHELAAEIVREAPQGVPSVLERRAVLARSRPVSFIVPRPPAAVSFNPHAFDAGREVTLRFRGDYLADDIPVRVGDAAGVLKRDARYPFIWNARIKVETPGRYDVSLGERGAWRVANAFVEVLTPEKKAEEDKGK